MKKIMVTVISIVIFGGLSVIQAQNGFAVWSKGGRCERELHYRSITEGTNVGEPKLVVPKGEGADIWPAISYDGEWLVWCRGNMEKKWNNRYGACDYHNFANWDIYVARIDFGTTIPVKKAIKIGNGYFPAWGEDAKTPGNPKTLYYTDYSTQTIQKTIVQPDGSFSKPVVHSTCPKKVQGTGAHTMGSPDGKFILFRPSGMQLYSVKANKIISGRLNGCHPTWGPRSKYFIRAQNGVFFNTDTSVIELGNGGVGPYFQSISNDAYWDEGRLWVIGKIGGTYGAPGSVEFQEVAIDGKGGWELSNKRIKVGTGDACDIHMFPKGFDPVKIHAVDNIRTVSKNGISFSTQIKTATSGLQLIIYPTSQIAKLAELLDIQGKRVGFIKISSSMQHVMPLQNIANGRYILKVSGDKVHSHKSIFISR